MNLLTLIMLYIPNVAAIYHTMFSVCNMVVTNSVASHVYRKTKFGCFNDPSMVIETNTNTVMSFAQPGGSQCARRIAATTSTANHIVVTTATEVTLDSLPHPYQEHQGLENLTENAKNSQVDNRHEHPMLSMQGHTVQLPLASGQYLETSSIDK